MLEMKISSSTLINPNSESCSICLEPILICNDVMPNVSGDGDGPIAQLRKRARDDEKSCGYLSEKVLLDSCAGTGHWFHSRCAFDMIKQEKTSCPLSNTPWSDDVVNRIIDDAVEQSKNTEEAAKIKELARKLRQPDNAGPLSDSFTRVLTFVAQSLDGNSSFTAPYHINQTVAEALGNSDVEGADNHRASAFVRATWNGFRNMELACFAWQKTYMVANTQDSLEQHQQTNIRALTVYNSNLNEERMRLLSDTLTLEDAADALSSSGDGMQGLLLLAEKYKAFISMPFFFFMTSFAPISYAFFAGVSLYDFHEMYFPEAVGTYPLYDKELAMWQYNQINGFYAVTLNQESRIAFLRDVQRSSVWIELDSLAKDLYKDLFEYINTRPDLQYVDAIEESDEDDFYADEESDENE